MRPSNRLLRAAAAERAALERQRSRLADEARDLRAALARIEAGMAEIDERRGLLDRLAPPEEAGAEEPVAGEAGERGAGRSNARGAGVGDARRAPDGVVRAGAAARDARDGGARAAGEAARGARDGGPRAGAEAARSARDAATVLRGPAIREAAVRVLAAQSEQALHYRDWFTRLQEAGYEVAGKDPLAVFLTQLSRSPAVRKGPRAGVYELDRNAAKRLTNALARLHEELATLTKTHDLQAIRTRRAQLTAEIDRTEKALEEIARTLAPPPAAAII